LTVQAVRFANSDTPCRLRDALRYTPRVRDRPPKICHRIL
jgi:hypothetical protein